MLQYLFKRTLPENRKYGVAFWVGIAGGIVSGFVKSGVEGVFPPRTADRALPPIEVLQGFGINVDNMIYHYSGHTLNWGVAGVHYLFSIVFAIFYCMVAEMFPRIKLWQGLAFGVVMTIGFHGFVLPLGGYAPPIWNLPIAELGSETFGHLIWAWTIEIFRRDLRNRITKQQDPEYISVRS